MTSINVVEYWPFDLFGTTHTRTFSYTDKTGVIPNFSSKFWYRKSLNQLVYSDYNAAGVWQDDWHMTYDPKRGVQEVSDWYPQKSNTLGAIFGPTQKQNLSTPIFWGNVVTIGQIVSNNPVYNPLTSTPPYCVHGSGTQAVSFEAILPELTLSTGITYTNVLQFVYSQSWNGGKVMGGRYWMAHGLGPIAISWMAFDKSGNIIAQEPRCDATVINT